MKGWSAPIGAPMTSAAAAATAAVTSARLALLLVEVPELSSTSASSSTMPSSGRMPSCCHSSPVARSPAAVARGGQTERSELNFGM